MDADELALRYPRLFHMAEAGSWDSARRNGLLSTSGLLDLYEVAQPRRRAIEADIRPKSVAIEHKEHGVAVIRDNKPLRRKFLEELLEGMTISEWCKVLNRHVFFWPNEQQLLILLNARAYRHQEHDVITVDTAELLEAHGERVRVCAINSGSTLYPNAPTRGRDTFRRLEDHPVKGRIAEVAVERGIPDIAELALAVERRSRDEVLRTLYRR